MIGRWLVPDPMRQYFNPYNGNGNNAISNVDPTGGENPVYDSDGNHRGNTSEGFTGEPIIYDGTLDFSKMTADTLIKHVDGGLPFDVAKGMGQLSMDVQSKIWNNIVAHFDGMQVYDLVFRMSDLTGGKIYGSTDLNAGGAWTTNMETGKITGYGTHSYETTVENVASSVIVHEWYSHKIKHQGTIYKSHRLAYKNVINYKALWNKTTDKYKGFNMRTLRQYTEIEIPGRRQVDPLYLNLYNKYRNIR